MKRFSLMLTFVGLVALGAYQVRTTAKIRLGPRPRTTQKKPGTRQKTPRRKPEAP
jgi:hypothetical protein